MAPSTASGVCASKKMPPTPSTTVSRTPPARKAMTGVPGELGGRWRWDERWGAHTDLFDGNAVRRGSTACGDPGDRGPTIDAAGSATVDAAQHSRRGADGGAGEGREPRDGALQVMP